MNPKNFENSLKAFQRQTPFKSFTVELVSGDRFRVDHPETLVMRAGTAVFVDAQGVPTLFDHDSVSQFIGNGHPKSAR